MQFIPVQENSFYTTRSWRYTLHTLSICSDSIFFHSSYNAWEGMSAGSERRIIYTTRLSYQSANLEWNWFWETNYLSNSSFILIGKHRVTPQLSFWR